MYLAILTFLSGISISVVAIYYSVLGMASVFSAAVLPVMVMMTALEISKLVAAWWLKAEWDRAPVLLRSYMFTAVIVLMLITSMGIFGFLSKAHSDQSLVSGDVQSKIAIYDEKIKTEKENIEANRRALKQMDEGVDQILGRSADEKGADKAVALRRTQQKERARLQAEISQSQKSIAELNDARAPIAAEARKVEAEVGPIKYIAAFVYGDNPDANVLEKAVTWVIIAIIFVFDPLAVLLLLASQLSFGWAQRTEPIVSTARDELKSTDQPDNNPVETVVPTVPNNPVEPLESILDKHPYLNQPFAHFKDLTPMVAKKEKVVEPEPVVESVQIDPPPDWGTTTIPDVERPGDYLTEPTDQEPTQLFNLIGDTHVSIDGKTMSRDVFNNEYPELAAQLQTIDAKAVKSSFGTEFPRNAKKGEMFIKVDVIPNKLFKFNGNKWIEVDKSKTDSYTYNEQYIQYLVNKLQTGEYNIDDLNTSEQEHVEEFLSKQNVKT